MPPTLFISAGEASGEHYGALLIESLKRKLAAAGESAAFFGMGGERMAAAGLDVVVRSEDMAVMGLTEVLHHLPGIYREFRKLSQSIRQRRPDVAVLIDFPEIHFRLAKQFHRRGVPVIFFVSPQLWAWKKHRINLVQRHISKMLVIFPFEEPFYRDHGVQAEFVGHPLAELPQPSVSREQFAQENHLDPARTWIALLPGSRPREIADLLPEMLRAARGLAGLPSDTPDRSDYKPERAPHWLEAVRPDPSREDNGRYAFIVPLAPTLSQAQRDEVRRLVAAQDDGLYIRLVPDARAALHHARASVVASGTATVEAALIGNPFVVVYRVSPLTHAIAKRIVKVPHVAMANLIAGKRIVPELIQDTFTASNIVQQLEPLLPDGPPRQSMMEELQRIRVLLTTPPDGRSQNQGAIDRVADVTLAQIGAGCKRK